MSRRLVRDTLLALAATVLTDCSRDYSFGDGIAWPSSDAADVQGGMDSGTDVPFDRAVGPDASDVVAMADTTDVAVDVCTALCSGTCTDTDTDPQNCGTCGNNCVGLAFGHATCVAGVCGAECNTGYHKCNDACVDDTSVSTCGTLCSPCPTDTHASATCDGTQCALPCDPGYHKCNGHCVDSASVNTCGTGCSPCPTDPVRTTTCDGTACGLACSPGKVYQGGQCVPVAASRQIEPLSTATVTSRQPVLRWVLAPGADGAHVQLCRDRAMTVGCQSFDAAGTSGMPVAGLAVGVWFWRIQSRSGGGIGMAASAVWQFIVGVRSAGVNRSFGTTLDVNGDGYADLVVGAYGTSGATGSAYVYLGGSGGLSTTPANTLVGTGTASEFGYSVASAGDVNGDGYADLLIGAIGTSASTGSAYVYLGGSSGLSMTPATTLMGPGTGSVFGKSVASAGDVNGDGYADVVVGAIGTSSQTGSAYIYLGGSNGLSTTPATTLTGPGTDSQFGYSVASAGDVNGDGHADLVVGAIGTGMSTGSAYVYLGSSSGISTTPTTTLLGASVDNVFGISVANAGDLNGDGYADLVVGADGTNMQTGSAYVYLGSSSGISTTATTTLTGTGARSYFGISVASAGDVNGDGYADLAVGAYGTSSQTGSAFVYLGGSGGISTMPTTTLTGPGTGSNFGISVASAGDTNGDNEADLAVGAYGTNSQTGSAFVYPGGLGGLSTTPTTTLTGTATGSGFGYSVASAGDTHCEPRGPTSTSTRFLTPLRAAFPQLVCYAPSQHSGG